MFLEKDTTWHDYIELLEFGMPFQQVNLKQLPRVVFLKTQDAHRARASELESTGTARSIRCRNWHQVETDWKRRISELKLFDCQNLSKLFRQLIAAVWTRCTCAQFAQSCHLRCPRWGWQPPIWWTSFHLWPAVPRHGNCEWKCVNICSSVDSMWECFSMA